MRFDNIQTDLNSMRRADAEIDRRVDQVAVEGVTTRFILDNVIEELRRYGRRLR